MDRGLGWLGLRDEARGEDGVAGACGIGRVVWACGIYCWRRAGVRRTHAGGGMGSMLLRTAAHVVVVVWVWELHVENRYDLEGGVSKGGWPRSLAARHGHGRGKSSLGCLCGSGARRSSVCQKLVICSPAEEFGLLFVCHSVPPH